MGWVNEPLTLAGCWWLNESSWSPQAKAVFSAGGGAELVVPNFSPIKTDTGKYSTDWPTGRGKGSSYPNHRIRHALPQKKAFPKCDLSDSNYLHLNNHLSDIPRLWIKWRTRSLRVWFFPLQNEEWGCTRHILWLLWNQKLRFLRQHPSSAADPWF